MPFLVVDDFRNTWIYSDDAYRLTWEDMLWNERDGKVKVSLRSNKRLSFQRMRTFVKKLVASGYATVEKTGPAGTVLRLNRSEVFCTKYAKKGKSAQQRPVFRNDDQDFSKEENFM
ncbi:MAG: hypothetical protein IIT61_03080 [Bacteroidales bacterium]|nr:hypothetical protein [Bacteroidales bacterium]MBQ2352437.1 hypothetical protein [Bacteroidales bacterium]MBQ5423946.1 hypothetical protein [Bacteroidales bacterium]MBQ5457686.1 hypothetical protein [Bacteroidales bacterium]